MTTHGFVHLHNHTDFSIRDGIQKLAPMCATAARDAQPAIAITDHGTMAGAWEFSVAARNHGIKPIIGVEAYIVPDRFDVKPIQITNSKSAKYYHITLLAETPIGYQNLVKMLSVAWSDLRSGNKPLIDFSLLGDHSNGVIALSGCLGGMLTSHLSVGDYDTATGNLNVLHEIFDQDHLFVEVMSHGIPAEERAISDLLSLAREFSLRPVVTSDAHFTAPEDAIAQEAQLAMADHKTLLNPNHWKFDGEGYWLKSAAEMWNRFGDELEEGLRNTLLIAESIDDHVVPDTRIRIPQYDNQGQGPLGESSDRLLYRKVLDGAKSLYGSPLPQEVKDRLRHEYDIIQSKGFSDYFLVVADMLDWARKQGILVGPGRGSAAGSLIAYTLGIVKIDPLKYGLLFERFLNPDRTEMPDIDSDFENQRRDEVIQYLSHRWGEHNVAHIGSFGYTRSKSAVRDAARVLEKDSVGALLAPYISIGPDGKPFSLATMLDPEFAPGADFRNIVEKEDGASQVVELALKLEDSIRSSSIHACGIVVSTEPLDRLVPTRVSKGASIAVTEWDHHSILDMGLLKLDLLGLKTLGAASYTIQLIRASRGIDISLDSLPDTDDLSRSDVVKTWEFIGSGQTNGIFQLESEGMQKLCVQIQPRKLEELGTIIALYRPGPMGMNLHESYALSKQADAPPDYRPFTSDPDEIKLINAVLGHTRGIPIFQEQLMTLSGVVAGFSPSSREKVRKAVGKKIASEMEEIGHKFLAGAVSDVTEDGKPKLAFKRSTAEHLWDAIKSAGAYAFNASHAQGYALLSWQMAYLRANYPAEMAAGIIFVNSSTRDKMIPAIHSIIRSGVTVLPPDVSMSDTRPTVVEGQVLLGFDQIKGQSDLISRRIIEARSEAPFADFADFCSRAAINTLSGIMPLIESGALDRFGSRLGMLISFNSCRLGQSLRPVDIEWTEQEIAWREGDKLGLTLTVDLFRAYRTELKDFSQTRINLFSPKSVLEIPEGIDYRSITVVGVVTAWEVRTKGIRRASIELSDGRGHSISGIIWNSALSDMFGEFADDPVYIGDLVAVSGRYTIYRSTRIVTTGISAEEAGDEDVTGVEEEIAIPQIVINKLQKLQFDTRSWSEN